MSDHAHPPTLNYAQSDPRSTGQFLLGTFVGCVLTQLSVCAGAYASMGIGYFATLVGAAGIAGVVTWGYKSRTRRNPSYGAGIFTGIAVDALLWGACYLALNH